MRNNILKFPSPPPQLTKPPLEKTQPDLVESPKYVELSAIFLSISLGILLSLMLVWMLVSWAIGAIPHHWIASGPYLQLNSQEITTYGLSTQCRTIIDSTCLASLTESPPLSEDELSSHRREIGIQISLPNRPEFDKIYLNAQSKFKYCWDNTCFNSLASGPRVLTLPTSGKSLWIFPEMLTEEERDMLYNTSYHFERMLAYSQVESLAKLIHNSPTLALEKNQSPFIFASGFSTAILAPLLRFNEDILSDPINLIVTISFGLLILMIPLFLVVIAFIIDPRNRDKVR